jgi:thiol-disulfide isomerase/thioredoxin
MEEQDEEQFLSNTTRSVRRQIQEKAKLIQRFTRRSELEVLSVDSIQQYKDVVVDENDRIVVARFWASWCKSCRASEPHFKKLVSGYQDSKYAKVKFVDVPLTQETALLQTALSIPSIPFVHIYYPGAGLVEELKLSKPHIQEFDTILKSYIIGYCDLPEEAEASVGGAFQ